MNFERAQKSPKLQALSGGADGTRKLKTAFEPQHFTLIINELSLSVFLSPSLTGQILGQILRNDDTHFSLL